MENTKFITSDDLVAVFDRLRRPNSNSTGYDPTVERPNKRFISQLRTPAPEVAHVGNKQLLMPGEVVWGRESEVGEWSRLNPQARLEDLTLVEFDWEIYTRLKAHYTVNDPIQVKYGMVSDYLKNIKQNLSFAHLDFCMTAKNSEVLLCAQRLNKALAPTGAVVRCTMIKRYNHLPYYKKNGEGRVFLKVLRDKGYISSAEYKFLKDASKMYSTFQTLRFIYEYLASNFKQLGKQQSIYTIDDCVVDLYSDSCNERKNGVNMETVRFALNQVDFNPSSVIKNILLKTMDSISEANFYSRQ